MLVLDLLVLGVIVLVICSILFGVGIGAEIFQLSVFGGLISFIIAIILLISIYNKIDCQGAYKYSMQANNVSIAECFIPVKK